MKKLASTVSAALLVAVLAVGLAATGAADEDDLEEETTVDVDIDGVTQLDVRPTSLSYTDGDGIAPGEDREVSDGDFEHIEVENIGSERIGNIWAESTMPTENPFGTEAGEVDHDTGNFVTLSLDTAQDSDYGFSGELSDVDNPHYLNRVEYLEETPPTYIQTIEPNDGNELEIDGEEVTSEVDSVDVGRFRVGGAEYFFVIYDEEHLLFGDSPHTSTELGTTDFTNSATGDLEDVSHDELGSEVGTSDVYRVNSQDFVDFDTEGDTYGGERLLEGGNVVDDEDITDYDLSDIDAEVREYNLYVDLRDGQENVIRTRFNVFQDGTDGEELEGESDGDGQEYILSASGEDEALHPGQNFPVNLGVQIPLGVDQDSVESGSVTVFSETFEENGGD